MRLLFILAVLLGFCPLRAQTIPVALAESASKQAMMAFPDSKEDRIVFMQSFCEPFLDQWRYMARPVEILHGDAKTPYARGYKAGLKALAGNPQLSVDPGEFGYVFKTIEGTYNGGFELSEFVVDGTGERFHTNSGMLAKLPEGKVRLNVWMSPETVRGFGHFNQWKREIILVEIAENKNQGADEPASVSKK
jgi:hypothetical protein